MADEVAAAEGSNGAGAVAGANADPAARAKLTRQQQDEADKAAFLAGYPDDEPEVEAAPAPKKKPAKVEVDDEDEAPVETADEEDEDADPDADDADLEDELDDDLEDLEEAVDDEEEDEDASGKADPDVAKAHAKVRKAETRMREGIARERAAMHAEVEQIVADFKPRIAAAQAFEKIPKSDVIGILKAKGYTEDDLEDLSKILYGHSKAAAADPKNRVAVAQLQEKRELRAELAETKARQAALEEKLSKRDESDATEKRVAQYMGRVQKAATAEATPILKAKLELFPQKTAKALRQVAFKLSQKSGQAADPKKVVLAYEKLQRTAGVTVESVRALRKAPAAAAAAAAGKGGKTPIKVVDKTADKSKKTATPSRADMINRIGKINSGELDPDAD